MLLLLKSRFNQEVHHRPLASPYPLLISDDCENTLYNIQYTNTNTNTKYNASPLASPSPLLISDDRTLYSRLNCSEKAHSVQCS